MCGISNLVKVVDLLALALLVTFTAVYLWPSISSFTFTTDLPVIAPWWTCLGSLAAIVLTVVISCCMGGGTTWGGWALAILALLNVVAYGIFAFKGNLNTICDGASELAEKAAMAEMVNCGAGWMKYAIWALLVIAGVSQLAVAAMTFGWGSSAGSANALGKRSTPSAGTTLRSLGRRNVWRKGGKHRWGPLADEESNPVGQREYPLRTSIGSDGGSGTSSSDSGSDSEGQGVKDRGRRRSTPR